jgi:hypothetical protein
MSNIEIRVGSKVVCIIKNGVWHLKGTPKTGGPKYGDVCTVSGFFEDEESAGYVFAEWLGIEANGDPVAYDITAFEPVRTTKTDTSETTHANLDKWIKELGLAGVDA